MIEFKNIPANDEAADNLVKELKMSGYGGEEAQRLVDAAAGIAISILRGLDDKIKAASESEDDWVIIQQLVLHQLKGSCMRGMELNALQYLMSILGRN